VRILSAKLESAEKRIPVERPEVEMPSATVRARDNATSCGGCLASRPLPSLRTWPEPFMALSKAPPPGRPLPRPTSDDGMGPASSWRPGELREAQRHVDLGVQATTPSASSTSTASALLHPAGSTPKRWSAADLASPNQPRQSTPEALAGDAEDLDAQASALIESLAEKCKGTQQLLSRAQERLQRAGAAACGGAEPTFAPPTAVRDSS